MRNLIMPVILALMIAGCASNPAKAPAKKTAEAAKEVKPTYSERLQVAAPDTLGKMACPRDGAWTGQEWKKIIPMANACVKAKDWRKVDMIGDYLGVHASLTPWGAYYMSLAAGAREDYPRAVWMLELALKKSPTEGLFHYQLGRMHWEMGDHAAALKSLKTASDMNPGLTDAHWISGQIALQRGENAEAARLLEKALNNNPKHFGALMAMASLKGKAREWTQAEDYLARAVRANPKDLSARQALSQVQDKVKADKPQVTKNEKKVSSRKPAEKKVSE